MSRPFLEAQTALLRCVLSASGLLSKLNLHGL